MRFVMLIEKNEQGTTEKVCVTLSENNAGILFRST